MMSAINSIFRRSSIDHGNTRLRQSLRITTRIASILGILTVLLMIIAVAMFGPSASTPFLALTALVFLAVVGLAKFGYGNLSRVILCIFPPLITLFITYLLKTSGTHTDILYYDSRFILVIFSITPCLVFSGQEKIKLYGLLGFSFLCLLLFDPLHELVGQGYYQKGFTGSSYYFINPISWIAFLGISTGALTLKIITEKAERRNEVLLAEKEKINIDLQHSNKELHQALSEIEAQHEEMIAQAEELKTNQEKLEDANVIIQHQRNELSDYNRHLEDLIKAKSEELIEANTELIKHNSELRQFSYTVSHNLRAPVARLLGLTNLLEIPKYNTLSEEIKKIILHIRESSHEFDSIIRDLNKIIDIRNELYKIKEKVILTDEFNQVMKLVQAQLTPEMNFHAEFNQAPFIYTVRPVLNSILYNLITNAIKYRSPHRPLSITLKTSIIDNFVVLEVSDNGLGINLDSFGHDIFGMYKRFHTHTDGKGLGLYLVKSQIESLGGKIEVSSTLNAGSTFSVHFKTPEKVEGQICFDSDFGTIFYNARTHTTGIVWKNHNTSEQYRAIFNKCLEILRIYNTPYWITDLRKQGKVEMEDQKWMLSTIFPEAIRNGLVRIAGIYDPSQHNEDYRARITEQAKIIGVELNFFQSSKGAEDWIEEHLSRQAFSTD